MNDQTKIVNISVQLYPSLLAMFPYIYTINIIQFHGWMFFSTVLHALTPMIYNCIPVLKPNVPILFRFLLYRNPNKQTIAISTISATAPTMIHTMVSLTVGS